MSRIKLSFGRLSITEKVAKALELVASLTGNAEFPNPNPPLATVTTLANSLDTSRKTAQTLKAQYKAALDEQAAREDDLDQAISQLLSYVESVAGTDDKLIHSLGLDTRTAASSSVPLPAPTGPRASVGDHDAALDLTWDPVAGARSYVIQMSTDPPTATSWSHAGSSTKAKINISNLTSGTRYWFRVAAIGASGQSGWSDPITRIAP